METNNKKHSWISSPLTNKLSGGLWRSQQLSTDQKILKPGSIFLYLSLQAIMTFIAGIIAYDERENILLIFLVTLLSLSFSKSLFIIGPPKNKAYWAFQRRRLRSSAMTLMCASLLPLFTLYGRHLLSSTPSHKTIYSLLVEFSFLVAISALKIKESWEVISMEFTLRFELNQEQTKQQQNKNLHNFFFNYLTKEIQKPLTNLKVLVSSLKSFFSDPTQLNYLLTIDDARHDLELLIADTTTYFSIESSDINVSKEPLYVDELLHETVTRFNHEAIDRDLEISFTKGRDFTLPLLLIDQSLFDQITENLLSLAIWGSHRGEQIEVQFVKEGLPKHYSLYIHFKGNEDFTNNEQHLQCNLTAENSDFPQRLTKAVLWYNISTKLADFLGGELKLIANKSEPIFKYSLKFSFFALDIEPREKAHVEEGQWSEIKAPQLTTEEPDSLEIKKAA